MPMCKVSVSDAAGETCEDPTISIDATGSRADTISVEIRSPSGARRTLTAGDASALHRWGFESAEREGLFEIAVIGQTSTSRGNTLECRAEATVTRKCCAEGPPTISLVADKTNLLPGEETTLRATPAVSDCTSGGLRVADSEALEASVAVAPDGTIVVASIGNEIFAIRDG